MVEIALNCIRRGWYVFPCKPKAKEPLVRSGFHAATNAEDQIREWWTKWPDANVGIATGASGLTVLDIDTGISSSADAERFCDANGLPATYTVRTGRRPGYGLQMYFKGGDLKSFPWMDTSAFPETMSGDIRSGSGYVMAAGSVHPSGAVYEALVETPIAPQPAFVTGLRSAVSDKVTMEDGPITTHRNETMLRLLGRFRNGGADDDEVREKAVKVNETRMMPPLGEDELERIIGNVCKWSVGKPEVEVVIGKAKATEELSEPVDWRTRYMTKDAYLKVQPPAFLIEGFLVKKSIAMLAGPVAQRKSIIALNIAHALCTGDPLFGYFDVTGGHERVVYLCPEMGAASFVKRVRQIGLSDYVGKTLFIQTMSETPTALDELDGELPGAVVIVDTITRFIDGDENKSEDMRKFAAKVFRLMNAGATVVLLHHSKKGSSGSLDDGLRGSSELAAFVDSAWVTELEDPKKPYESLSKMRNVKQRDFESDPFKLKPAVGSYHLAMEGEPEAEAVVKSKAEGAALEVFRGLLAANPKMGVNKISDAMRNAGHGRGAKWVMANRAALRGSGVALS